PLRRPPAPAGMRACLARGAAAPHAGPAAGAAGRRLCAEALSGRCPAADRERERLAACAGPVLPPAPPEPAQPRLVQAPSLVRGRDPAGPARPGERPAGAGGGVIAGLEAGLA